MKKIKIKKILDQSHEIREPTAGQSHETRESTAA